MIHRLIPFVCALLVLGIGGTARAETLGTFTAWTAVATNDGGKVCFIATAPEKSEGDYTQRGDVFLMVSHRPAENAFGVIVMQTGYTYKPGADAMIRIDGKTYKLLTDGENAWAHDDKTDRALVQAMKAGNTLVVTGTSSRGTLTKDTFSLSGFTAAYNAASKACGVRP